MESKIRLAVLFSFIVLFSCKQRPSEIPKQIIPKDSMINIMVDLYLTDALIINPTTQSKIRNISSNSLYQSVLYKYKIDKERFDKSLDFYSNNPQILDSMYDIVITKLSLIQSLGYKDSLFE